MLQSTFTQRRDALTTILKRDPTLLIAFSGGVDSSALLVAAVRALGRENVVAATAESASYPSRDRSDAASLTLTLGVEHVIINTAEVENPLYAANEPNRCYICKTELFTVLEPIQKARGICNIAYGEIVDDAGDFRPGQRAAREFRVLAPLREAGFTKNDARELLQAEGFPELATKPASACLSSRIPYGTPVVSETLRKIGICEEFLQRRGYRTVRVRHHNDIARLELDADGILKITAPAERESVVAYFRSQGYQYITLDLGGYRQGSLNEVIIKADH
ncbi:MAG: ATP-dependent sacrificial sulfur transferase LarE [Planctomycetota bacterium]